MIRVAVADDQALVRSGFAVLLRSADDIDVVGEAADGARGASSWRPRAPRRDADGHPHARDGRARGDASHHAPTARAATRVLILTTFDLDEYVFEALRAGASGFLLKDTLPDELLAAVRVVAAGEALLAPKITRRLIAEFAKSASPTVDGDAAKRLATLTEHEREVLGHVTPRRIERRACRGVVLRTLMVRTTTKSVGTFFWKPTRSSTKTSSEKSGRTTQCSYGRSMRKIECRLTATALLPRRWQSASGVARGAYESQSCPQNPGRAAASWARPSSYHSGGVNVAFGGGRVVFLRENIDYQVYIALMTMNERQSDSPNPTFLLEDKHYQ